MPRHPHPLLRCARTAAATLAALGLGGGAPLAQANPGYYVLQAYDQADELAVELRYWTVHRDGRPAVLWPELGASWGVNARWTTGLLASWIGTTDTAQVLETLHWRNDLMLTQGEWPWDLSLHTDLVRLHSDGGRLQAEWGPVLQTDFGRTRVNTALLWQRGFGGGTPAQPQLQWQWRLSHRWAPGLRLGVEGFSEFGPWDDAMPLDRQSHRIGPMLDWQPWPGDARPMSLQLAWLRGKTFGKPGSMFSLQWRWGFDAR